MNNCLNCKFAEWARTKNGRVNPRQAGRCTWTKTVRIPPYAEPSLGQNNGAIVFEAPTSGGIRRTRSALHSSRRAEVRHGHASRDL